LESKEDPHFRRRIKEEAKAMAWQSLGLDKLRAESQKIKDEIAGHEKRREEIAAKMLTALGESNRNNRHHGGSTPRAVADAIKRAASIHERELMGCVPLGKQILELQKEKEELLDTVWLATSPVQIKDLWARFIELLNWEPPELQREALAVSPISED